MGQCYITRRGTKTGGAVQQLGIYPTGNDGRPMGNVTVLDNVTTLSKYPFIGNGNVLTIALPENLRGLADYCFQKCTSLQNVSIPNKITTVSSYCFDGCTSLSKVVLPKNLTAINQYAFQNCTGLYEVVIPDEIESITVQNYAFSGCQGLDNETVTKLATLCSDTVSTYAFANLTGITEVVASYTTDYYFSDCSNLIKATILKPLASGGMGSYVFRNCVKLTTVVLPNNATIINDYMFSERSSLSNVNIPTSLTSIGSNAFNNTGINNITLPDTLTTISTGAFNSCTKLTSINIPDKVTTINNKAFYNCTNLTSVIVSENANYTLGQYAFQSSGITDEYVTDIIAHASTINSYVFDGCDSLVNVVVPAFANYMFSNCVNLKTAKSTGTASSTGGSVFYSDTALETVILSNGTTTIGTKVFYGCTSLKTVYLPSSITTATSSSLTSTSSSYYAFYNCTALEDVQLGQDWNMSLRLNVSNNLTVDSMVAMFNSLKDLTGDTAKTLTLGSTNLAKLTDEQKLIATNKNWTLA